MCSMSSFWQLLLIDPEVAADEWHTKMSDGHDGDTVYITVDTPAGAKTKIWKPSYSLAIDTQKNKQFMSQSRPLIHYR